MKKILLFFIALALFIPFGMIGFVYQLIRNLFDIPNYFLNLAVCIDQTGGIVCQELFNDIFVKKDGYKFKYPNETISSVLGKNYKLGKLTIFGLTLANFLDLWDENHVIKSITHTNFNWNGNY